MPFASPSRRAARHTALLLASLPLLFAAPLAAQDEDEEDYNAATIVVTGAMRVTAGGAQDIQHFRSISLDDIEATGLPRTASFTAEGLLSEHDLFLPSTGACAQLFCLSGHAMQGGFAGQSDGAHFLGIGFESGIDADSYRAEPLSLVAVVDRSGSMNGAPIARVKEGLHAVIDQMREGDRLGIVLYGSTTLVHQEMIDAASNRAALHEAVDAIAIDGSTYMEAGMKLGFATAFEELEHSGGKTRLMLFTDENPNVGDTSAEGFMGQAIEGSRQGVGMTTVGVGAHFDGALATRVSSVRGGNLFFVAREGSASELFGREFTNMVSEVAQDLVISIDPAPGVAVAGVYGVPGEMIGRSGGGTVTVTIGSAFLSSNGGGIFAALEGDPRGDAPLAELTVSYTDAVSQKREHDSEFVALTNAPPLPNLAKAHLLVDEYVSTSEALALYHDRRDAAGAARVLAGLSERISTAGIEGMEDEADLVNALRDGAVRLADAAGRTLPHEVFGEWRVLKAQHVADLDRGDRVEITDDGEFITERMSGRDAGEEIYQAFAINERQLHIEDTRLVLEYRLHGDRLTLRDRHDGVEVVMLREDG